MKVQIFKTLIILVGINTLNPAFAFNTKESHKENCLNCHKENGTSYSHDKEFYESRSINGNKLKSFTDLKAQINRCSNYYDTAWFPEEEADIVKYLNDKYYQFSINSQVLQASNSY